MRASRRWVPLVTLAAVLVFSSPAVGIPLISGAPWGVWVTEPVATIESGWLGEAQGGIALDGADRPHIMAQTIPAQATHATLVGGVAWSLELMGSVSDPGGIATDPAGNIHATWHADDRRTVTEGTWTDAGLVVSVVDTLGEAILNSRLHFDASGREHVTYGLVSGVQKYAYRDPSAPWATEVMPSGLFHDSAVDAHGGLHVVSHGGGGKYAYRALTGSWNVQSLPMCYWYMAIAVDSDGHPHITCQDPGRGLVYLHYDGAQWIEEDVDNPLKTTRQESQDEGYDSDLALDGANRPHIVYRNRQSLAASTDPTLAGTLTYATKTDIGWVFEEIDRVDRSTGYSPAIVLDDHDRPHVSYARNRQLPSTVQCVTLTCLDLRYATPALGVASDHGVGLV